MTNLPAEFLNRMERLLGAEYPAFLNEYGKPDLKGLRVNRLRCSPIYFILNSKLRLKPVPFTDCGFYTESAISGKHPWHHAGLFYMQEPSAMSAVTALDVKPGMNVLDLCAAPGGKSTQAAAQLDGKGIIVCNEVVPSRASALMSNLERCGVRNAAVTSEKPQVLCEHLEGFFDRVLVDAPCSGEGMFRRDPEAAAQWQPDSPAACARRQLAILESARLAVKGGGLLVYSTCTFAPEENEGVVDAFLKLHPEFELEAIETEFGRSAVPEWADSDNNTLRLARRVLPMDGGEGHFVARMKRTSGNSALHGAINAPKADKSTQKMFEAFYKEQFSEELYGELSQFGHGSLRLLPEGLPDFSGINLLRAGVEAGNAKFMRFEPAHALYMAADADSALNIADFTLDDPRLAAFLHGEQVEAPSDSAKGWVAVKAQGYIVGFGKVSDGVIKNHYPKGLRNLKADIEY